MVDPGSPTLSTVHSKPLALHTRDDNVLLRSLFDTTYLAGRPAADGIAFLLDELPTDLRFTKTAAGSAWRAARAARATPNMGPSTTLSWCRPLKPKPHTNGPVSSALATRAL